MDSYGDDWKRSDSDEESFDDDEDDETGPPADPDLWKVEVLVDRSPGFAFADATADVVMDGLPAKVYFAAVSGLTFGIRVKNNSCQSVSIRIEFAGKWVDDEWFVFAGEEVIIEDVKGRPFALNDPDLVDASSAQGRWVESAALASSVRVTVWSASDLRDASPPPSQSDEDSDEVPAVDERGKKAFIKVPGVGRAPPDAKAKRSAKRKRSGSMAWFTWTRRHAICIYEFRLQTPTGLVSSKVLPRVWTAHIERAFRSDGFAHDGNAPLVLKPPEPALPASAAVCPLAVQHRKTFTQKPVQSEEIRASVEVIKKALGGLRCTRLAVRPEDGSALDLPHVLSRMMCGSDALATFIVKQVGETIRHNEDEFKRLIKPRSSRKRGMKHSRNGALFLQSFAHTFGTPVDVYQADPLTRGLQPCIQVTPPPGRKLFSGTYSIAHLGRGRWATIERDTTPINVDEESDAEGPAPDQSNAAPPPLLPAAAVAPAVQIVDVDGEDDGGRLRRGVGGAADSGIIPPSGATPTMYPAAPEVKRMIEDLDQEIARLEARRRALAVAVNDPSTLPGSLPANAVKPEPRW